MVELDLETQRETGKLRLIVIPGTTKAIFLRTIREHIKPMSLIFTDSHRSYSFLSRPNSGFVHRAINHKRREFSREEVLCGVPTLVSTNAAEGLFGRVKQFFRQQHQKRIAKKHYGLVLAEYLWKKTVTGPKSKWRKAWPLLDLIQAFQVHVAP